MKKSLLPKENVKKVFTEYPKIIAVFSLLLFTIVLQAQKTIPLSGIGQTSVLADQDNHSLSMEYNFDALQVIDVKTSRGEFHEIFFEKGYSVGELGKPKLPAVKKLIEIPFGAEIEWDIENFTEETIRLKDFDLHQPLMPVQPSLRKDQNPGDVPFEYKSDAYSKTDFTERELVQVEILGVMRGVRIARVTIAPVQYNPESNTIKVYNNIRVDFRFKNADKSLTEHIKETTFSPYFESLYANLFNYESQTRDIFDQHPDLTKDPVKMLIVSHSDFEETLQPFILWKTQMGFEITEAYTDEIGTGASAIQSYIHQQYNDATPEDPAPTFLVIVGDSDKIPASTVGSSSEKVTDLYYASVDGDYFPEMYYGRLSARNTNELQNQLDKILYYEKYEFEDPSYLDDVTLIAGADGTWNPSVGQPTVQYGTEYYFNQANGFNTVNQYLSDYSGCYDNDRISVSFINYTAHCSPTSWGDPNLSVSDVHNMTNEGKYPLAIGNCCLSGLFSDGECIGEAWVRAANKGAVAYIGSAPNTYWFEDFYWSVGAFPIQGNNNGYVPTDEETTLGAYDAPFTSDYLAVGALKFVGNLAVTEVDIQNYPQHSSPLYYWQAYHTFGDPSTFIYMTQGEENQVTHSLIVPIGLDTYTVNAEPGSYVAISQNGVLHGAAFVGESGEVEVPIEPIVDADDVTIVVTKSQYIPYIQNVPAAALEGPFVVLDSYDFSGDAEAFIYGETTSVDVTVKNVGADNGIGISGTLTGSDPYFTLLTTESIDFGDVNAGDTENTATVENAFSFEVSDEVPDQYEATFILNLTDGENEWQSNMQVKANAPLLVYDTLSVDDPGLLNPGVLDPGETADIMLQITNTGHAANQIATAEVSSDSPWVIIQQSSDELISLEPGLSEWVTFTLFANNNTPPETPVELDFIMEMGSYTFEETRQIVIGQAPVYDEGDIPTTFNENVTTSSNALEPGVLTVTIPEGATITGVDVEYDMTAFNGAWMSEQRSFLRCVTEGGTTEGSVAQGSGTSAGTFEYNRTGLNIANDVVGGGEVTFELHAFRTWGGSGSDTEYNYVDNNSWKIIVHFTLPGYTVDFLVEDTQGNALSEAEITINDATYPAGMYQFENVVDGDYEYQVSKYAYTTAEGNFTVDGEDLAISVTLEELPTYEAVFTIEDTQGNQISDAVISINGNDYDPGQYTIDYLVADTYEYEISKDGFHPVNGQFEIVDQNITLSEQIQQLYSVTFDVTDGENEITNASITFNDETLPAGLYKVENLLPGEYNYSVNLDEYFETQGSITISDQNEMVEVEMEPWPKYNVTFDVKDVYGENINDAVVSIDGESMDENQYVAEGLFSGSYSYAIAKEGYLTVEGDFELTDQDLTINAEMQDVYTVSFDIICHDGTVEDAIITMNGNTHESGIYTFHQILPGTHTYTITRENYYDVEGEVFIDDHQTIEVFMIEIIHEVHFNVSDEEGNAITDAIVTFDGNTHEAGDYVMLGVDNGMFAYSIEKEGYNTYNGNVLVSNQDVVLDIALTALGTGVASFTSEGISVYPNPSAGEFQVLLNGNFEDAELLITNYQGQVLQKTDVKNISGEHIFNINISDSSAGIYYLSLMNGENRHIKKIIIK
ncbi:MAG: C25 family cysteine peptidase [Bacteroidales bacterium]